jgi:hypothetical protein
MKWTSHDIEQFQKAQEYIDTAVIPLIPVEFGTEMKQAASMSEFITLVTALLERQLMGRILLLPPFTYLTVRGDELRYGELEGWVSALKNNQLKHIFLITCDSEWKARENKFEDSLIWIPAIPLENLEDSQKIPIVESQVQQIFAIFSRKWQEIE